MTDIEQDLERGRHSFLKAWHFGFASAIRLLDAGLNVNELRTHLREGAEHDNVDLEEFKQVLSTRRDRRVSHE